MERNVLSSNESTLIKNETEYYCELWFPFSYLLKVFSLRYLQRCYRDPDILHIFSPKVNALQNNQEQKLHFHIGMIYLFSFSFTVFLYSFIGISPPMYSGQCNFVLHV